MKLDKSICKGAKLDGVEIVGLKIGNSDYLFETTGPSHLNIYTIQLPCNGTTVLATVHNNDVYSIKNENNYTPIVNWGEGTTITDDSGERVFTHLYYASYISGGSSYATYKIKTTCELQVSTDFPGDYIIDIGSVRTDYLNGHSLFAGYSGIKTIREPVLERLNTSIFNYMNGMFQNCTSLEKLNLSSFDTSKVYDMSDMFNGCTSLISLDLSNFNTSCLSSIGGMFTNCSSLEELSLANFDLSNVTISNGTSTISIFGGCTSLKELYLDNCSYDTINKFITSANFPTDYISGGRTIYCKKENAADLEAPKNWNFYYIDEEESVDPEVPEEPTIPLYSPYEFQGTDVTEVVTMVDSSHTNLNNMFDGCTNLVSVNTEDWDTSNVYYMEKMFQNCTSLTYLDLSSFSTSNISFMDYMFSGCTSLEILDLRNFYLNYWNVEEDYVAKGMFKNCTSLYEVYLNNCDAFTISQIIQELPNNSGITGTIYCKQANLKDEDKEINNTTPPSGWKYSFVN